MNGCIRIIEFGATDGVGDVFSERDGVRAPGDALLSWPPSNAKPSIVPT